MDERSTTSLFKACPSDAVVPPFINPESIEEKLNWVPSLQRLFRQHVQLHPVPNWTFYDGNLYVSIYELLRLPDGLARFEDSVKTFDPKGRGLLKTLLEASSRRLSSDLKTRPRSSFGIMSAMIKQGEWDLAAWLAWTHLELPSLVGSRGSGVVTLDLIDEEKELVTRLGPYWTHKGWLRSSSEEIGNSMQRPAVNASISNATLEACWKETIDDLARWIRDAKLGEDISQVLAAASERLFALNQHWAESGAANLQARREQTLAVLADALCKAEPHLPSGVNWPENFIDRLAQALATNNLEQIDEVEAATTELTNVVNEAVLTTRAEDDARAAHALEDSDEADAAYAMARGKRRRAVQELKTFAEVRLPQLLRGLPADSGETRGGEAAAISAVAEKDYHTSNEGPEAITTDLQNHESKPDHKTDEGDVGEVERTSEAQTSRIDADTDLTYEPEVDTRLAEQTKLGLIAFSTQKTLDTRVRHLANSRDTPIETAIANALIAKRYGLAHHLAAAAQAGGLGIELAPAVVFEALAVGAAAGGSKLIHAASRYKLLQEEVLLALDASPNPYTRLLVFAGALRPALFAPDSSGVEILGRANVVEYGLGLHELCQFVTSEIRGRGLNLTPADFEPVTADGDRRAAEQSARETLIDFAGVAHSRKLKFHRASTIWSSVFRQGPVADAIAAIQSNAKNAPALAKAAEEWIFEDTAEQRVDWLDARHRTRKDRPLEAGARLRLADWLRQTAQHLSHWLTTHEARERTQGEHVLEKLHELRRHLQKAQTDLQSVAACHPHLQAPTQAAVDVVTELLARSDASAESPLTLEMTLNDDLLLFKPPILRRGGDSGSTDQLETIVCQGPDVAAVTPDFQAAFHVAVSAGHFGAARQLLERLVAVGAERSPLELTLKTCADVRVSRTIDEAEKLRRKIDDLLGADQLAMIDVGLSARLDNLITALRAEAGAEDTLLDFAELDQKLKSIEEDVRNGFEILLVPLRHRIGELKAKGRETAEFEEMAEHHDLATLAEHIDAAFNDVDWTAKRASALLESFANNTLTDSYERIPPNERSIAEMIRAAEARSRTSAADFSALDEGEATRACELLSSWRDLRNSQSRRELTLAKLMGALGFGSAQVKDNRPLGNAPGAPRRMTLQMDKIADREICRVPAFGSEANGRYEVIFAEPSAVKTGEELTGWLDQLPAATTTPTLVVVAGHLPLKSRNLFMGSVRRRGGSASCALIDEAMIIFLSAQPDRRRGHLFDLALPMGLVQPYADTAARTSQEMFYGRKKELDDLWDRNGSCLVYGGRQLGKTALLKQIQLRYNQPPTQLVVYGDLQAELPGANGNNIWIWLGRKLKSDLGSINRDMRNQAEVETAIRAWLGSDGRRRLLVLVDEADEFLRQELVNQYTSLAKIRDLMQATDRYCKFVFAGLHDVQRLARTPNSPLLHFGAPVRVGPLMGNDLPEARAMAEGPMAAAGFVFDSSSLTGRMLSQVGYYPSLLQAFAKGLIERMNKSVGRRSGLASSSLLPLKVSGTDLDETFQDRAFRENIQLKFESTLNLDERYRLITFVMLVDSLARRDQGVVPTGLKDAEVQRLALEWWPQGFAEDQSLDAFQGLLQEMIGLGVLIEQADGRFVIRSARIADMLGGREQIERKLTELSYKEAPSRLDTGALRRLCVNMPSPLTARQETVLLSDARPASAVQLLVSSRALGIDQIADSLVEIGETNVRIDRRDYQNLRQIEQAIETAATAVGLKERGLLVLWGPWLGTEMVTLAARHMRVRQAQKDGRFGLRVLIVPYDVDWRDLASLADNDAIISLAPLGENSLGHFVKQYWGDRFSTQPDESQIKEIYKLTGGFPLFLNQPKGRGAPVEIVLGLRERIQSQIQSRDFLDLLGLSDNVLISAIKVIKELGYDGEASDELMREEGIDNPHAALIYLERLGVIERHAGQQGDDAQRRLNPFVAAALAQRGI